VPLPYADRTRLRLHDIAGCKLVPYPKPPPPPPDYLSRPAPAVSAPSLLNPCLADLHIHTGSAGGQPVKITASRALTVRAALYEAHARKGLAAVGLVDAISLLVERELAEMVSQGELQIVPGGGLHWSPRSQSGARDAVCW
jgi:hypothetical protein